MISTLVYRDNKLSAQNPPPDTLAALRNDPGVMLWVDLSTPADDEARLVLETTFAFHPLAIEDCVEDTPFPKVEAQDDCLHVVMHAISPGEETVFKAGNIIFFIGKNFLVTFHKAPLRIVDAVRERYLRTPSLPVRGPDRLAHTILDQMVDGYKPALETLRRQAEEIAGAVIERITAAELFPRIAGMRKQLSRLRQVVRPQRAVAAELAQGKSRYIRGVMLPYLRDLEEELGRIETQAASLSEQLIISFRVFLNKSNHEANTGIRVMTALTALTFPALLIGGWYGMNFVDYMPELAARYGYLLAGAVTLLGTAGVWGIMAWKKWL